MRQRIAGTAALVAITFVSIATAGVIFVPVGGKFVGLDQTAAQVRERANGILIETSDLSSQLDCAGQPPDETFLALRQSLRLRLDRSDGRVSGTVRGSMDWASAELALRGFPLGGDDCSVMIVDLVVRSRLVDVGDPMLPALLDQRLLGSLMRNGDTARWVRMEADVRLGGSEDAVAAALTAMGEGESCAM